MDLELKGKAAVIIGGSVVIGSAAAEDLAVEGVNLVVAARQAAGRVDTYTGLTSYPEHNDTHQETRHGEAHDPAKADPRDS